MNIDVAKHAESYKKGLLEINAKDAKLLSIVSNIAGLEAILTEDVESQKDK